MTNDVQYYISPGLRAYEIVKDHFNQTGEYLAIKHIVKAADCGSGTAHRAIGKVKAEQRQPSDKEVMNG